METVRTIERAPLDSSVTEEEVKSIQRRVLTLQSSLMPQEIEATLGLTRFASWSRWTRDATGRLEMEYFLDFSHHLLIIRPGGGRTVAPLMHVWINDWEAKLERSGWRVISENATKS
jgi:hypothetical protein